MRWFLSFFVDLLCGPERFWVLRVRYESRWTVQTQLEIRKYRLDPSGTYEFRNHTEKAALAAGPFRTLAQAEASLAPK